jgi:hypothetical protein
LAHRIQQKKLRFSEVQLSFEHSVENKGWNLLQGTYLPMLLASLKDLRVKTTDFQAVVRESAKFLHGIAEISQGIRTGRSFSSSLGDIQPGQVCGRVRILPMNANAFCLAKTF